MPLPVEAAASWAEGAVCAAGVLFDAALPAEPLDCAQTPMASASPNPANAVVLRPVRTVGFIRYLAAVSPVLPRFALHLRRQYPPFWQDIKEGFMAEGFELLTSIFRCGKPRSLSDP